MYGKGEVNSHRRLSVLLTRDILVEKVELAYDKLNVKL
ncbi:phosphoribosylglycinamide formyltransferase [Haemophilus sp. C1]|nr:phosphoribosylglycinamide formyltransferase [Haemophilus sp. C1]